MRQNNRFKSIYSYLYWLGVVVCTFFSLTCDEEANNPDEIVFPDSNVSYGRHVEPLFSRTCIFSVCHSSTGRAGGLSLETYSDAIFQPGVIIPRNPDDSRLIRRVEGRDGLIRMPMNLPPLSDAQIKGLRQWILEGAQNN